VPSGAEVGIFDRHGILTAKSLDASYLDAS
jgi:hypothetical protein